MNPAKSIGARAGCASVFSILIFGISTGIYSVYREKEVRTTAVHSQITVLAGFLLHQALPLFKQTNDAGASVRIQAIAQIVSQNTSNGDFCYIELFDANGLLKIPSAPNHASHDHALHYEGGKAPPAFHQNLIREDFYPDSGPVIEGAFALIDQGRILGTIVLGVSRSGIDKALLKSACITGVFLLMLSAAAVYLSWKLGRQAAAPVLLLARTIETLKDNDGLDRLELGGTREVELLSAAFKNYVSRNRLFESGMQHTIREKTKSLEKSKSEMKAILNISNRLSKVLDLEEVVLELVETAKQIVYCNEAYVYLLVSGNGEYLTYQERTAQDFVLANSSFDRYPKPFYKSKADIVANAVIENALLKCEVEIIEDTRVFVERGKMHASVRSCALFPILSPTGHPLGVLFLAMTGESRFDQDELMRLKAGMKTVGVVFDNVLLYSEKEKLSRHDSMTGLLNRQNIIECFQKEIVVAQRRHNSVYILMADIDHFKTINDTFGHLVGDKVIKAFAKIIGASRRAGEYSGRFGGEEFLIVLPHTNLASVVTVAEKILHEVRESRIELGDGEKITFRVSIGVAGVPESGSSVEDVINKADKALYFAKAQGRNQFVVWSYKLKPLMQTYSGPKSNG